MKKNDIWAFLIHLSWHMWDDPSSQSWGMYLKPGWSDDNECDLEVWDNVIRQLPAYGTNTVLIDVGDAVQYDSHPEISAPDAWSKAFLRQKLDEIRALGMTPIPKLNFSACHDAWLKHYGRMVSTPQYYQVCADLIEEVCEIFDRPALFHLGMDEETDYYQRNNEMTVCRNGALWEHDLEFFCAQCEKHGARPWIWSAFLTKFHREYLETKCSHNILMSTGYYRKIENNLSEQKVLPQDIIGPDQVELLDRLGFEQVVLTSTWGFKSSTLQMLRLAQDKVDPSRLLGFITAPWLKTEKREYHGLLHGACKLYYEREKVFPESI